MMTAEIHDELVSRAREHIAKQRAEKHAKFEKNRSDWAQALQRRDVLNEQTLDTYRVELRRIAEELIRRNKGGYWATFRPSPEALMGWLHHRGCCVYCEKDLINREYMADGMGGTDHLLPRTYSIGFTHFLNAVPACSGCNGIKRDWDPNTEGGPKLYDDSGSGSI